MANTWASMRRVGTMLELLERAKKVAAKHYESAESGGLDIDPGTARRVAELLEEAEGLYMYEHAKLDGSYEAEVRAEGLAPERS